MAYSGDRPDDDYEDDEEDDSDDLERAIEQV